MSTPEVSQSGTSPPRALLYGDMDLNIIDGSTVWVQSMAELLARAGCAVTLVLKSPSARNGCFRRCSVWTA